MKLSADHGSMASGYQAVIIGSGAAGCVAAARLASAGLSVCLLERGGEQDASAASQGLFTASDVGVSCFGKRITRSVSRLSLQVYEDVGVLNFNGLGGSCTAVPRMLVPPADSVFQNDAWPIRMRGDLDGSVLGGINRASSYALTPNKSPSTIGMAAEYLQQAVSKRAQLFTHAHVQFVNYEAGRWQVFYNMLRRNGAPTRKVPACVYADIVVIAAGAPASAEILLKSKTAGLSLSARVGEQIGFAGCVISHSSTSVIDKNHTQLSLELWVDGTLHAVNDVIKKGEYGWSTSAATSELQNAGQRCNSVQLQMENGIPVILKSEDHNSPASSSSVKVSFLPFGGCIMADNAAAGAVNDRGQVFSAAAGDRVYPGLYVLDESILPCSVGTDPLLTVVGLAERACALMIAERGLKLNCRTENPGADAGVMSGAGVRLTEEMKGFISPQFGLEYEAAAAAGQAVGLHISVSLCIECDCIDSLLEDEGQEARVTGTVTAPALADTPLQIIHGRFRMYQTQGGDSAFRQMQYRLHIRSEEGTEYTLIAFRRIPGHFVLDAWPDMSTVYLTIMKGAGTDTPLWGSGILRTDLDQFARQLNSIEALNVDGPLQRLETVVRFGRFYAGRMWDQLGGPFSGSARSDQA